MLLRSMAPFAAALVALAACQNPPPLGGDDAGAGVDLGDCAGGYLNSSAPDACPLACSPLVQPVADEGALHVPAGTTVNYRANPPASGPHWPSPAPWGNHSSDVVAREAWVHNAEHGGIILLYNCPQGCPDVESAFVDLFVNQPEPEFPTPRMVITADPLLPDRIAAVAWDWSYVANTLDVTALRCFIQARYGRGPENAY